MKISLYKTLLLLLVALYSLKAYPQDKVLDSLTKVLQSEKDDTNKVNTLMQMSWHFNNYIQGKPYADEVLALSNKLNYIKGQGYAYNYFGVLYHNEHNDSAAVKNYLLALKFRQQSGEKFPVLYTLLNMGDAYRDEGNYTEALKSYYEALSLTKQLKDTQNIYETYLTISRIYNFQHNYAEALKTAYNALEYFKKSGDKHGIAWTYEFFAGVYEEQNNNAEWLKNSYTSLKLYEELGDKKGMSDALQGIGAAYNTQGNDSAAVTNLLASVKLREQLGEKARVAQTYATIAGVYKQQGKITEALEKYSIALKLFQQPNMPAWGPAMCYSGMAGIYEEQGDADAANGNKINAEINYGKAENQYLLGLKAWENTKDVRYLSGAYNSLGFIYIHLKKYPLAKKYLQKSEQISRQLNQRNALEYVYNGLSTLDSIGGDYKQAYEHYKLYRLYRDSVSNEETSKKFLQVQLQHENDLKEEEAKAAQQKKDADAKRARTIQYLVICSLGILILAVAIIAVVQYRSNKQKQKANLLITQQKEKVESTLTELKSTQAQLIQSEKMASLGELTAGIAHEIQNPLNFVTNFSEVNTELIDELEQEADKGNIDEIKVIAKDIKENEQKINHHGKRADAIVKGMLQHSRSSTGYKEPTDINALADEYLRLSYHGLRAKDKEFNATMQIDFDKSIGKINIIPQDIGRVLLNLYNNAFYAVSEKKKQQPESYEPIVFVSTKKENNKIRIIVRDNGNGIPQSAINKIFQPFFTTKPTGQGTGLGLSLSYDTIKAHGGEIKIETKEDEGSEFIIQIPVT